MLSQFTGAILQNGDLTVNGVTTDDVASTIAIHFAVTQGDAVVRGTVSDIDGSWSETIPDVSGFATGPALAFGVAIGFRDDAPAFQTFHWAQDIEVHPSG